MFKVYDERTAKCALCLGDEEKPVFDVRSKSYSGEVCNEHFRILLRSAKKNEKSKKAKVG